MFAVGRARGSQKPSPIVSRSELKRYTLRRLPDAGTVWAVASGGAPGDKAHRVNVSGRVMPAFICETCGSQFTPSDAPPPSCPICQDERQFVPPGGQKWTTLEALARRHFNCYQQHELGLIGVGTVPKFSIGQIFCGT